MTVEGRRPQMQSSGIFFDGANIDKFRIWVPTGTLEGATTNPGLLKEAGISDVPALIREMITIVGENSTFPISVEIPDTRMTFGEMVELAKKYYDMFPNNIVIKVPMDPRDPTKPLEVMHKLAEDGIRVNATLGLSGGQLILAAEALRKSKANRDNYISLFWGRRDVAREQIIKAKIEKFKGSETQRQEEEYKLQTQVFGAAQTLTLVLNYLENHGLDNVKVIVGSVREPHQIDNAFFHRAHIVTIRPELLEEWMHTQRGVETADEFNKAFDDVRDNVKLF